MVELTERNQLLQEMGLTEGDLKRMKRLGWEEATWQNDQHRKHHIAWANRRHEFIKKELAKSVPKTTKAKRTPDGPPIVSRRTLSGHRSNTQTYAEKFA